VCQGLAEAHEQNVIHRDLKPQNIMVHGKDRAKIMDFGIARVAETSGVTKTGLVIGTPDYMSPEQADGAETDQRSDIYSLGVILYEMITGKVPFEGTSALRVVARTSAGTDWTCTPGPETAGGSSIRTGRTPSRSIPCSDERNPAKPGSHILVGQVKA
jgi:serine/threonine protein kinase